VGALIGKIPLQPKIAFMPRRRVGRDDGDEKRAVVDLAADFLVPDVPAPKLTLVEENLDARRTQCVANPLRSLRILGCIA
jgi:hypothetical protein